MGWLRRSFVGFVWGWLVVWLFVYVVDVLDNWFVALVECLICWHVDLLIPLYAHRSFDWLISKFIGCVIDWLVD